MMDNECNILSNMSKTEFREFRSLMVEMVLHTGDDFIAISWDIDSNILPYIGGNGTRLIAISGKCKHFLFRHVNAFLPIEVNEEFGCGF